MSLIETLKDGLKISRRLSQAQLSPLMAMVLAFLATMALLSALFAIYALVGSQGGETETIVPDWNPPTLSIIDLDPPKPENADDQALSRPIFAKTRRPSPKAASRSNSSGPIGTTGGPTGVTVGAIVMTGKTSQAFILSSEAPAGEWKKIGDTVDAWIISTIARDQLILRNGGRSVRLRLYEDKSPQPPPFPQELLPSSQAAPPPP
jgi:hypothetical protein